jgi:uncharacterized membrane protein YvbJ
MPICYSCNNQLSDDVNYCPECGNKVKGDQKQEQVQSRSSSETGLESYILDKLFIISKINEYTLTSLAYILIGVFGLFAGVSIILSLEGTVNILCFFIPIIFVLILISFGLYYSIKANKFKRML